MKNLKLTIAYDGSDFNGWQKTSTGPSIEEMLEHAFNHIFQKKIDLQAASRTDRGVHAENQVVNCLIDCIEIDTYKLIKSLNSQLPPSIVVKEVEIAPEEFHPTTDCVGKEYHYYLTTTPYQMPRDRLYAWHAGKLNIDEMRLAAQEFIGCHDFSAFCNQRKNLNYKDKNRTIFCLKINEFQEGLLRIEVIGNHFLYKMVRNIVGTLVYIGKGKLEVCDVSKIISSKQRIFAGITAPAHGLFLHQIFYRHHGVPTCENEATIHCQTLKTL